MRCHQLLGPCVAKDSMQQGRGVGCSAIISIDKRTPMDIMGSRPWKWNKSNEEWSKIPQRCLWSVSTKPEPLEHHGPPPASGTSFAVAADLFIVADYSGSYWLWSHSVSLREDRAVATRALLAEYAAGKWIATRSRLLPCLYGWSWKRWMDPSNPHVEAWKTWNNKENVGVRPVAVCGSQDKSNSTFICQVYSVSLSRWASLPVEGPSMSQTKRPASFCPSTNLSWTVILTCDSCISAVPIRLF